MRKGWSGRIVLAVLSLCAFALAGEGEGRKVKDEKSFPIRASEPLTVEIEITAGEMVLEKGSEPGVATAILEYIDGEFRPKIDYNEKKNRLLVRLGKRNWKHMDKGEDRNYALVTVRLPLNRDIYLDYRLKAGETNMNLGGLRLKEVGLSVWAGQLEVDFDTPNLIPMDYLEISTKVGEAQLHNLGNARYKEAFINGGIGELVADFSGSVEPDSKAEIDLDIGEATVVLPDTAGVRMEIGGMFSFMSSKQIGGSFFKRGRYYYSDDYDEKKLKCTFHITPGLGELRVEGK